MTDDQNITGVTEVTVHVHEHDKSIPEKDQPPLSTVQIVELEEISQHMSTEYTHL